MLRQHQKDGILVVISHQGLAGDFTHYYQWEQVAVMGKTGKNGLIPNP
ncbi:MAG: hypothetical protein ABR534_10205 [Desulfotignum sp.]